MMPRSVFNMGHLRSKTRSQDQSKGKPCEHSSLFVDFLEIDHNIEVIISLCLGHVLNFVLSM